MSFTQETFSAEFNDPNATIFSQQGGQFATDYAWWGGIRTLSANGELETYVDPFFGTSPYDPFSIANGVLTISAIPTPAGLKNDVSTPYVSGMLETSPSFAQQYGYFEMRAQLPAGQGLWPAFWMVGENQSDYTEIDILEALGNDTKTLYFTTHMNATRGPSIQDVVHLPFDYSTGMHTYGLAWTPDWLIMYADGQEVARLDGTPMRGAAPMFMIANEAVGGSWPGSPDASTQFPAQMKIDYIRAYAYSATTTTPTVTGPQPVTVGSGSDSLVVTVNEDAYQGDAQFTVSVDGTQVGGTQTTTASHASGQTQAFTFNGTWGTGQHTVAINFVNDAYGGSAAADRNLYVTAMSYDGTNYPANTAALQSSGPVSFTVGSATTTTTPTTTGPQPVTVGTGTDSLVVTVNEDAYQGDAQFTVSVDGVQVGGTQTTTASHASGQTQAFTFKGAWGAGQHTVAVNFLYDAWGGSAALDRNLYVTAMSYDGTSYPTNTAALMTPGPVSFTVGTAATTTTTTTPTTTGPQPVTVGSGTDSLVVTVNEDAYQGDAQFTVSVDGVQVGGTQTATASHASGQTQAFTFKGSWGTAQHTVAVSFLNDAYGGSPSLDRNLYVDALSYDGSAVAITPAALQTNATATFVTPATGSGTPAPTNHTLVLQLSEDAWRGDAQFTVAVDNKAVGSTNTVSVLHSTGASQAFTFTGTWGSGPHTVGVTFINDAWGGSAATDRNLYVNGMSYDGSAVAIVPTALMSNGTANFTVG